MFDAQADAIITNLALKDRVEFDLDMAEGVQSLLQISGASEIVFNFTGLNPETEHEGACSAFLRFPSPGTISGRIAQLIQDRLIPVVTAFAIDAGKRIMAEMPGPGGYPAPCQDEDDEGLDDDEDGDGTVRLDLEVSVRRSENSRYAGIHLASWTFHGPYLPENYVVNTHSEPEIEPTPEMAPC